MMTFGGPAAMALQGFRSAALRHRLSAVLPFRKGLSTVDNYNPFPPLECKGGEGALQQAEKLNKDLSLRRDLCEAVGK